MLLNNWNEKQPLFDSYRVKNPDKQEFSWEVLNLQIIRERIYIILVFNELHNYVTETGIIPVHETCFMNIEHTFKNFCFDWGIPWCLGQTRHHGIPQSKQKLLNGCSIFTRHCQFFHFSWSVHGRFKEFG